MDTNGPHFITWAAQASHVNRHIHDMSVYKGRLASGFLFKESLLHGMPAGHDVSRFRSGIFFFIGVINVHINLCIKLCPPLVRIYCSDCLQQKRPNQNLFFRHISRERGPTHHFCVTSNHHLIYSLKLD